MGDLIHHHQADSMEGFQALSEAGIKSIEGYATLRGSMMIIVEDNKAVKCAPELVQTLHNWLFKGGDPPEDWNQIQIYKFNQSAAHKPFQTRSTFPWFT